MQALPIPANPVHALLESGLALHEAGRVDAAIDVLENAVRTSPGDVASRVALGCCLLDAGRVEAAASLLIALPLDGEDFRALMLRARILLAQGEPGAAIGALSLALAVQPGHAAIHTGLANALAMTGAVEQALAHSLAAFRLSPDHTHASNFSGMLSEAGHFEEALVMAEHALGQRPDHFCALVNRASALAGLDRWPDAIAAGRHAVAMAPDTIMGRIKLAATLLRTGQMTHEAWDLYEARLRLHTGRPWAAAPRWRGEDLAGRTILLHAEQGLGDTLQFARYAPLAAARGGRVLLAVQAPLLRLLRGTPGVDQVVAVGDALPPHDVACPLLSLPGVFGTTLASIPPPLPYCLPPTPACDAMTDLRVGLVWAGNPDFTFDCQRSLPPLALGALAGIAGVHFYSLQHPNPRGLPPTLGAVDLMADVQDFAETAALVAGLDLVIAVDTAVAHLAATMGKPVWLLCRHLGCWRWLHDRADSPWYPSLRVLRQSRPNDWGGVLTQVAADLRRLARP